MIRQLSVAIFCVCLALAPVPILACGFHMFMGPGNTGFGGAAVSMKGLAPPETAFKLVHPSMTKAAIGEESEIIVRYSRPLSSKNVRMELKGTSNVELQLEEILLEDRDGTVTVPYQLTGSGFDQITLTVSGELEGKTVRESGRIYLRASGESPKQELQVSER